jgi:hypothetical protein
VLAAVLASTDTVTTELEVRHRLGSTCLSPCHKPCCPALFPRPGPPAGHLQASREACFIVRKICVYISELCAFCDVGCCMFGRLPSPRASPLPSPPRVVATRTTKSGKVQYLVKWCGLGYASATWEDESALFSADDQARCLPHHVGVSAACLPLQQLAGQLQANIQTPGRRRSISFDLVCYASVHAIADTWPRPVGGLVVCMLVCRCLPSFVAHCFAALQVLSNPRSQLQVWWP